MLGHQGCRPTAHDHRRRCVRTDHGQAGQPVHGQRQDPVVLQEDHRLGGCTPGQGPVGRLVQLLFLPVVRFLEGPGPLGQEQEATDRCVHHRLGYLACLDGIHQPLSVPVGRPGHLQVQPGYSRGAGRPGSEPVRDHDPVEAPLAAQHRVQHPPVLGCVGPVHPVVGSHHAPRPGVLDRHLERTHRDLSEGPFVHLRGDGVALELGVVGHEVLDRGPDAAGLHTTDVADGDPAGQVRVLGHALEVPPTQRGPVQVHRRGQQHMTTPGPGLGGQHPTQFLDQPRVPGCAKCRTARNAEGGNPGTQQAHPTRTVRTIRHLQRRDAQAFHRLDRPEVAATHQRHLLGQRQLGQQFIDAPGHGLMVPHGRRSRPARPARITRVAPTSGNIRAAPPPEI